MIRCQGETSADARKRGWTILWNLSLLGVLAGASIAGAATELDTVGIVMDGLYNARDVAVSPDGAHVYAAAAVGNALVTFERDAVTGELDFVAAKPGIDSPRELAISPDGAHVYAAVENGGFVLDGAGAILAYARNATTGELTLIESESNALSGVRWINPLSVVVSPDGTHVYAASFADEAVVAFRRDATTGRLSFIEGERSGPRGLPSLGYMESITASPDGEHLYATGRIGAITVLAPDFSCSPAPEPGCRVAAKGKLNYGAHLIELKERITWTYANGPTTTLGEFEPGTDNHYALCVYDESGMVPELALDALAPAVGDCPSDTAVNEKPCWATLTKTVNYNDRFQTPDGLSSILLKPSSVGKTAIKVKGAGVDLPSVPLPLGLPVRVQLQSDDGLCWETFFATASKNDGTRFKAKTP